jgi:hypothetical protein
VRQSSLTWCNKAVNLSVLLLRAASRTPRSPRDLRLIRPGVRGKAVCSAFLLAESLSSADSADASAASLFAGFAGTMDSSDFRLAFISALPSGMFSDRSATLAETNRISRFSRLEFSHMHRVFDSAASDSHSPC